MEETKVIESQGNHPHHRLWSIKNTENVEYFNYFDSLIMKKEDVSVKLIPGCHGKSSIQQDQVNRSCEKWRTIKRGQGGKKRLIHNKKNEG